jgi:hypothetical protein
MVQTLIRLIDYLLLARTADDASARHFLVWGQRRRRAARPDESLVERNRELPLPRAGRFWCKPGAIALALRSNAVPQFLTGCAAVLGVGIAVHGFDLRCGLSAPTASRNFNR